MHFRPALFFAIFLALFVSARAGAPPVFLTGTGSTTVTSPYPDYLRSNPSENLKTLPVGKTLVVPIVVSGSGPMTYTATSTTKAMVPIIKTGYPVLNIGITSSGTTDVSGTIATLYPFTGGTDGGNPQAPLFQATDGNYYGTTVTGTGNAGTVFKYSSSLGLTTLHQFTGGADGGNPVGGVIQSGTIGGLFGTTGSGGANGAGTVYLITVSGSLTTLYSFTGGADGGSPMTSLVTGSDGNLYGTTSKGGAGGGTVFQITISGSLTTLHSFTGSPDGGNPEATLISGSDGNLYGTTESGGANGDGTIFVISTTGSFSTLYSFTGGNDGANPFGGVQRDGGGNLYGTTAASGSSGFGTIYRLNMTGTTPLTTLYTFTGQSDGGNPFAGLLLGTDLNYYGTATTSGTTGQGTIFRITPAGIYAKLAQFPGGAGGGKPYAGLIQDTSGNFFGTAETGGTGFGTIYEMTAKVTPAFTGTMSFALLRDMAPKACSYVAGFAQGSYYTTGTGGATPDFYRITNLSQTSTNGFIAQAGDPGNSTGGTGVGFSFDFEFNPSLIFSGQGQLAMANSGFSGFRGTNGGQFFINQGNQNRFLDFNYTIFGQMLTGFDVMDKMMAVQTGSDGSTPTSPVVINSVNVSQDNTDAILFVSASAPAPNGGAINITARDPSGAAAVHPAASGTASTPGLSIFIQPQDDTTNDPPIITPIPNIFAARGQKVTFPIKTQDLEFDYVGTNGQLTASSTEAAMSVVQNIATVLPNPLTPQGDVEAGVYVTEPFKAQGAENESAVNVSLGAGKLSATPSYFAYNINNSTFSAFNSTSGTSTMGSFICSDPSARAADFTTSINWGDGSLVISSTSTGTPVTVAKSGYLPTTYNVSVTLGHAYPHPGIYPMTITVSETNGGVLEIPNLVVSGTSITAYGRTFTAARGSFDSLVANFADHSSNIGNNPAADNYKATINWGDGTVTSGIVRGSNGSFQVYGKHKYTAGTTYPVDVAIQSNLNNANGHAWSVAQLTGLPTHQPPFAQSHVVGELGNPGFGDGFIDEEVTLFNSGNLASGQISLEFFLSDNQSVPTGAVPLQVGNGTSYTTTSIPANGAISGAVSDIIIPSGTVTRGKFLLMRVITSDPLGNHMPHAIDFADPNPLIF